MHRIIVILMFFLSLTSLASELVDNKKILNVGTIHSIELDNHHSISIYLPESYNAAKDKYPVMYVIDGDQYFLNSIVYQKTLTWQSKSPDFIVVGINIKKNQRRELLGKKSPEFIDTFENKIINYVEKNYRTNDKRMYFGWEMAGGFALDLFSQRPKLIDAYFLASSTHFTPKRINSVQIVSENKKAMPEFFYYALGSVETWSLESHESLSKVFSNVNKERFEWQFNLSQSDDHYSTPLDTFNKGLALYFNDYAPIRFYSLKEFENFGGIKVLKDYYKKRGDHYQISTDIHSETKHYLLNQSINEGNFSFFNMLVSEFDGFIEGNNYSIGFIMKIGKFYSDNNAIKEAISLYKSALIKNPKSQSIIDELLRITDKHQ